MAISGMTGFARRTGSEDWGTWTWEARSVNGRSCDIRLNAPNSLDAVEATVRSEVTKRFKRGSFQISLKIDLSDVEGTIRVNEPTLKALMDAYEKADGTMATGAALASLMGMKGVVETEAGSVSALGENKAAQNVLCDEAKHVLSELERARRDEGAALSSILCGHLDDVERYTGEAAKYADEQKTAIAARYTDRLKEIDTEGVVSDERLAAEIAVLASKADVSEELDRLVAHIATGRDFLISDEAVGRNLGFLAQELNREANTLCSKSASLGLTNAGLALKSSIDQFKEQAANVE